MQRFLRKLRRMLLLRRLSLMMEPRPACSRTRFRCCLKKMQRKEGSVWLA